MKTLLCFLFLCVCLSVHLSVHAQGNIDSVEKIDERETFQRGYIVLKDQKDTLWGQILFVTKKIGYIEKVKFQKEGSKKVSKYAAPWKSELRYFGTTEKRCRYVNWTDDSIPTGIFKNPPAISDWVTLVEDGAIKLSLGFMVDFKYENTGGMMVDSKGMMLPVGGRSTKMYLPVYCLKKGDRPLALIRSKWSSQAREDDVLSYELDWRTKDYFLKLMDAPELLAISNNDVFHLYNVLQIVQEYNKRHKN